MACIRTSITGNAESILFNTIYDKITNNEQLADEMYNHFKSELFKKDFGDFIEDYKNNITSDRVDENGEPKLFYNETAKKYYYLNKNNEQVYFPLVDRGLRSIWNYEQINRIKSRLALNYFKKSKLDFNNIEFENASALPNIKNFILKEINDKINSLEEEGEYFSSISLQESLNYIDELVENVEGFFKEMSLTIQEDEENGEWLVEEEGKDPVFNQHSAERNTKDSISTNVKLRLSLLEDTENLDPIWNEPTFLNRDMVYSSLQSVLNDVIPTEGEDIFELHKSALNRVVDKKPYLKQLHEYLNSPSVTENQKSEFSQAFHLVKNNHIVSQYNSINGKKSHNTIQISDTGSKTTQVKEQWDENFKSKFLTQNNAFKESVLSNLQQKGLPLIKRIKSNAETLKKSLTNDILFSDERINKVVNETLDFLSKLGIETTEEGFQNYLDSYGEKISTLDMFDNLLTLIEQSEYVVKGVFTKYENPSEDYDSFINLSQTFSKLASSEAFFLNEGSDATILTGGKQKWIYSYPSYISTKVKQWKRKPELLLELYKSGNYQLGSYYMGILTGSIDTNGNIKEYNSLKEQLAFSKKLLDKIDVGIMNQMSSEQNFETTTDLAYKDYMVDYVNKVIKGDDFIRTTTQADKTTELQIKTNIKVSSYNGIQDGKLKLTKTAKNVMFNYFTSEVNRMIEANQEVENAKQNPDKFKLTPHYHYKYGEDVYSKTGNAFKSQYFEKLSIGAKNQSKLEKQITDILYTNGELNISKLERGINSELDSLFDEYLEENIFKEFLRTRNYLLSLEIFKLEGDEFVVNKISDSVLKQYSKYGKQAVYAITTDFLINGLINNIEFSKMFSGDVAYYKNMVDYKKRVPATYTDGLQLRITEGNENFRIATISSVYRKSPFYDKLVESLGEKGARPYANINSADAQAWITPQRWKFLLTALGKWSKAHDEVYKKMTSDTKEEYTEKELKIAAQPLKGVFFNRDASGKPTYLKYSQAVLSQDMIKGSDLEKVYNKMISDKVDELITFDGVKVGAIEPTTIHNEKGNVVDDIKFNVQTLSNRGWKLQQDLPTKTYKDIDVGSQIQKNIFQGLIHLKENTEFTLDGKNVSGQDVINEIVKTTTGLTNKGLESLKKEFGIDDNFRIGNISGFYKSLIAELEKRGGSENVINALKTETTIVGIPQSAGKLFNIFASVMNSRLIKIKTNGGSFIQMSNFGLNKTEANDKGVIWSPLADDTTNEPYIYVHPDTLKPTVKPGGVLISGSFLAKYIPNWRDYDAEELFIGKDGKPPIIDKQIQENIIGYRIPNQGLASNDALRIVGILPESAGDTIVAYTGITTKTGSDFDVDKMYVMFPSYKKENNSLIYKQDDLGNRLIELYKSVLTHPEVYKSVMQPIDIDFIEKELNSLFQDKSNIFMNHFDPEVDVKLRYSFLGGKAGVGQEANAMVDISREGQLSLNSVTNILWGHHNELRESKFDEEYSEELSDDDLNYYVSEFIDVKKATEEQINEFKDSIRKVKIGDSLTAILNAFVDIAKDPYISKGNWTMSTTNVGNLLLRIGAHPLYVVNFLANPVIKEYVEFQKSKESLTETETGDLIQKFKKELVFNSLNKSSLNEGLNVSLGTIYKSYFDKLNVDYKIDKLDKDLEANIINKEQYDSEILKLTDTFDKAFESVKKKLKLENDKIEDIINLMKERHKVAFKPDTLNIFDRTTNQYGKYKLDLKYFRNQNKIKRTNTDLNFEINILNSFKELQEYSKNVRENVLVSKSDTNGMGKDHNNLFGLFNLYDNIVNKVKNNVTGAIKGFETKFNGTVLEAYWNSLKWVKNVVENNPLLFPTGTENVQDIFNEISQDLYTTNAINTELLTDLGKEYNSYLLSKFFNLSKEETNNLLNELPKQLQEFKDNNKDKYFMLDDLNIKISKSSKYKSTIQLNNRKKSKAYETLFTNSWKDLMIDNPKLAEDLIKYSFITTGFQMNTSQFFTYIPSEYFTQKNINKTIQDISQLDNYEFLDLFYLNKLNDKKYVKKVFENKISNPFGSINDGFVNNIEGNSRYYVELNQKLPENAPADFKQKPKYYKLIGYDIQGRGVYKRIEEITNKLNDRNLITYSDYVELNNSEINKLESLVEFDRKMNEVLVKPEIIEEEFDLNSLDYGGNEILTETKQEVKSEINNIEVIERYSIENVKSNTNKIYIFGDNLQRTGTGGQAVIRNNENAFGIVTKLKPTRNDDAYMSDDNIDMNKQNIDSDINKIKNDGRTIVFPKDGLGTGLAKLKEKAPQTYNYLKQRLLEEFGFNNDTGEISKIQPKQVSEYSDEFFKQIDDNNIKNQLLNPKRKFTLLSEEQYNQNLDDVYGEPITENNIEEAFNNSNRVLENGSETSFVTDYYFEDENGGFDYTSMTSKEIYEDYLKEKNLEDKESIRKFLNTLGFNLKTQEEIDKTYKNPNQLSLFDNLQESKTMLNLKEMFNNGLMLNKFNESGINNIDDLNKLSEDELGELLKKICK